MKLRVLRTRNREGESAGALPVWKNAVRKATNPGLVLSEVAVLVREQDYMVVEHDH